MKQLTRPRKNLVKHVIEESAPAPIFTIQDSTEFSSNGANHPNPNGTEPIADTLAQTEQIDLSKYVTEEEYWAIYYDHAEGNYEWNNGYLEEKPMATIIQFRIYSWFLELLKDFLYVYNIGKLTGLEIGFRLNLGHKTTIRKPDLGVVLDSNPIPAADKDRTYQGIFDLCIESLSDSKQSEIERDTVHKKAEYAQVGVPEYYIFDDSGEETAFYSLNALGVYVPIQPVNGVIKSKILPGFQFRVDDLYTCPRLATLATDPIYSAFASPEYRVERRRADEASLLAEEERQRAEEERQRADEASQHADEAGQLAGEERQRAERAEQLAEEASQRAKEERQRVEEMQLRIEEERQRTEYLLLIIEEERQRAEQESVQTAVLTEQLRTAGIAPKGLDTK